MSRNSVYIADGIDRIPLGTRSGVYVADANSSVWSLLSASLPDVLVFELRYVAAQNQLYAGTLGRSVWS